MRGKTLFVAGTDTGVGKTIVTGLLARALLRRGVDVVTQKWVQTGIRRGQPTDLDIHLRMTGAIVSPAERKLREVYRFRYAASPHLAAAREKQRVDPRKLERCLRALARRHRLVLVEGTGGFLVPLTRTLLQLDLVKKLKLPVLLVVGNRLGAINQALSAVEVLRARRVKLLGLVFTTPLPADRRILADNVATIVRLTGVKTYGEIPFFGNYSGPLRCRGGITMPPAIRNGSHSNATPTNR